MVYSEVLAFAMIVVQDFFLQRRSDHIRTYTRAYLENQKNIYLFIYLFVYRFIGETRLLHMQEFFSHCIAATLYKENFVNIA